MDESWQLLLENLSFPQLELLKIKFQANNGALNEEEFLSVLPHSNQDALTTLFKKVKKRDSSSVLWSEFVDFLIENVSGKTEQKPQFQVQTILAVPHSKRESVVKIVLIESEKYFCYAIILKHGRVGLYDGNLNFLTSYHVIMTREDITRNEEHRRRRNRWVTDAIFCPDILMFIVTNTARSITIYEASGLKHVPLWLILSTPNIVQCFSYKTFKHGNNVLFMGDSGGRVFSFNFKQPQLSILRRKYNDKITLFYWDELANEKEFLLIRRYGKPHKEHVKQLWYCEESQTIISCSKDEDLSLVIRHVDNKCEPYIFKIHKGCSCFCLSKTHKILITGSGDGVLRLWNPLITCKPIAVLKGHQRTSIVDVKVVDGLNVFLSLASDGIVKLWDLKEQKRVASLSIDCPAFKVFGKVIEWGNQSIYPGPKRQNLVEIWQRFPFLVTCCNYMALLSMVAAPDDHQVLPPPPLQNSVLVPKMWRTCDDITTTFSSNSPQNSDTPKVNLQEKLNNLKFILDKNFFVGPSGIDYSNNINFKIASLEGKKSQMQQHVEKGAPYLALDLHEVEKLHLTPNLPVTGKKRTKNLAENVEKMLQDASFRDVVFSETSSNRSLRSSRSSIIEFEY